MDLKLNTFSLYVMRYQLSYLKAQIKVERQLLDFYRVYPSRWLSDVSQLAKSLKSKKRFN